MSCVRPKKRHTTCCDVWFQCPRYAVAKHCQMVLQNVDCPYDHFTVKVVHRHGVIKLRFQTSSQLPDNKLSFRHQTEFPDVKVNFQKSSWASWHQLDLPGVKLSFKTSNCGSRHEIVFAGVKFSPPMVHNCYGSPSTVVVNVAHLWSHLD